MECSRSGLRSRFATSNDPLGELLVVNLERKLDRGFGITLLNILCGVRWNQLGRVRTVGS